MAFNPALFLDVVRQLQGGKTLEELSEKLSECVDRAREYNKVAKLSLEITVKPDNPSGQYFLSDKVDQQLPQKPRGTTMFWGTPDNNLTRKNPDNLELELTIVPDSKETSEVVSVSD